MSHASPFEFGIAGAPELAPVSLEGREACSEPFAFSIVMRARADEARAFEGQLDQGASLTLVASSGARRTLSGVVRKVELLDRTASGDVILRYGFGPRFARLDERSWSRIHPSLSVPDAIGRVLSEHGVVHRFELSGDFPVREYQVQYQESDRAFVERLAAEVGLFYYFTGAIEGQESVLVVADGNARLRAVDAPSDLHVHVFEGSAGERPALREEQVATFQVSHASSPKSLIGFDYDFKRPLHGLREQAAPGPLAPVAALEGVADFPIPPGTVYEHRSDTERPELTGSTAASALDQWKHESEVARAIAGSRLLAPGYRFALQRHPIDGLSRGYVLTSVTHTAFAEESAGRASYQAELTCVAESIVPRPARPPRRVVQVTESAIVTGPAGHEIHTDEHGRVRIRFHWDTRGFVELASCFVRVVQPWAGEGWGFQFIPRIGMEVLVTFLQGDPDVPVVIGALSNATHPPPFPLPGSQTRSGIRTRSTRDTYGASSLEGGVQGFNEMSFEDTAGREQLFVRAQKDLVIQAVHDSDTTIGHNATNVVSADRFDETRGTTTVRAVGPATYWYAADATCHHQKDAETNVSGDLRTNVGGNTFTHVVGASRTEVDADKEERVGGNVSVRAGAGYVLDVGERSNEPERGPPPGEISIRSTGTLDASADKRTILSAGESLTLVCGQSRIELTPHQIVICAPSVLAVGTERFVAAGKGPSIELQEHARVFTQELQILTKGGSLEMGDATVLKGESIKLERPTPAEAQERSDDAPDTKRVRIRLTDARYRPYANCRFQARAEATRQEGSTDGEGFVELVVPKKANRATLTFWTGPYPTGERKERVVIINELPEIDTLAGVQVRLRNLGYYQGGTMGEFLDDATRAALRHFQHDNGLAPTGEPDDPTRRAIVARHLH